MSAWLWMLPCFKGNQQLSDQLNGGDPVWIAPDYPGVASLLELLELLELLGLLELLTSWRRVLASASDL